MNDSQREHYRRAAQDFVDRYAGAFDEAKHPRDEGGLFAEKEGGGSVASVAGDDLVSMQSDLKQIEQRVEAAHDWIVFNPENGRQSAYVARRAT